MSRREKKRLMKLDINDVAKVTSMDEGSYGYRCFASVDGGYGKVFVGLAEYGTTVGNAIENKFKRPLTTMEKYNIEYRKEILTMFWHKISLLTSTTFLIMGLLGVIWIPNLPIELVSKQLVTLTIALCINGLWFAIKWLGE